MRTHGMSIRYGCMTASHLFLPIAGAMVLLTAGSADTTDANAKYPAAP